MTVTVKTETSSIDCVAIDGDSLIFVAALSKKSLDFSGEPIKEEGKFVYEEKTLEEVIFHLDNMFQTLVNDLSLQSYYGFYGVHSSMNYRLLINPLYKAHRKKKDPPQFLQEARDYMTETYGFIPVQGCETDDILNIVRLEKGIMDCTADKDNLQTVGLHYDMRNKMMVSTSEEEAIKHLYWDMIVGQPADNISGIRKLGEKAAEKFFHYYQPEDYFNGKVRGDLLNLYITHNQSESKGITEFYKNYQCLRILEKYEELPENCNIKSSEDLKLVVV